MTWPRSRRMARGLFGTGLALVVVPLLACLIALPWYPDQEGPAPASDGTAPEEVFRQEPTPPLVRVAMWSLVAIPVGAMLVGRFGLARPDRLRGSGRRTLLLGTIVPSAVLLLVGTATLVLLLVNLRMSIPLVIATEVTAWACWKWASTTWAAITLHRTLGRSLGWEETTELTEEPDDDEARHFPVEGSPTGDPLQGP